jgi:hypothetical protein
MPKQKNACDAEETLAWYSSTSEQQSCLETSAECQARMSSSQSIMRARVLHQIEVRDKVNISRLCYALAISNTVHGPSIKSCPLLHLSASISTQTRPSMPCPCENRIVVNAAHLEYQRSTLGFLVTTTQPLASFPLKALNRTYPSSKCLHRFSANCAFVLHAVHSNLNTTFFVVLAFLWNTGFV